MREPKSLERFSPVRRGSEGSPSGTRTLSPSTPQQECQRLQRGLAPRASPPRSIPGNCARFFFFFWRGHEDVVSLKVLRFIIRFPKRLRRFIRFTRAFKKVGISRNTLPVAITILN